MPGKHPERSPSPTRHPVGKFGGGPDGQQKDPCLSPRKANFISEGEVTLNESIAIEEIQGEPVVQSTTERLGVLTGQAAKSALDCLRRGHLLVGKVEEIRTGGRVAISFQAIP